MKLSEIARALGGELRGDGGVEIVEVAPIEDAPPGTLTFLADRRLAPRLAATRAAAVLLPPDAPEVALPSVRVAHPYLARRRRSSCSIRRRRARRRASTLAP